MTMKHFKRLGLALALAVGLVTTANAANLTTQTITSDFTVSLVAAAGGGDAFLNDGRTFLVVTNGGGAPITVTVVVQKTSITVPGLGAVTFASIPVTVNNGTTKWIAVPSGPYNNSTGRVSVTYSGVTSVTVGAVRVPAL
jgi:hypothetical protein